MLPTSLPVDLANAFTKNADEDNVKVFVPVYVENVIYSREQLLLAGFLRHAKKVVSLFHVAAIVDVVLEPYAEERRQTGTGDDRKDFLAAVAPRLLNLMAVRFQAEEDDISIREMNEAEHILTTLIAYLLHEFAVEVSEYVAKYALKNQYLVPVLLDPLL